MHAYLSVCACRNQTIREVACGGKVGSSFNVILTWPQPITDRGYHFILYPTTPASQIFIWTLFFFFFFNILCAIQGVALDILSQFWFHLSTNIWWTLHGVSWVLDISLEDPLPNFIYGTDIYLLSMQKMWVSTMCLALCTLLGLWKLLLKLMPCLQGVHTLEINELR